MDEPPMPPFDELSDTEYMSAPEPSQSPPLYRSTTPFAPVAALPEDTEVDDDKQDEPISVTNNSAPTKQSKEEDEDDLTKARRRIQELEGELQRTRTANAEMSRKHRAESRQMSEGFVTKILEKEDEVGHVRSTLQMALEEARAEMDHLKDKHDTLQAKLNKQRTEQMNQEKHIAQLNARIAQLMSDNDELKQNIHSLQEQSTHEIIENRENSKALSSELESLTRSKIELALSTSREIENLRAYIRRLGLTQTNTHFNGETGH